MEWELQPGREVFLLRSKIHGLIKRAGEFFDPLAVLFIVSAQYDPRLQRDAAVCKINIGA